MNFKYLSIWNLDGKGWKDVPKEFLMTQEEMEYDLMEEYCQPDSDMSWDDLLNEMEMIGNMFK